MKIQLRFLYVAGVAAATLALPLEAQDGPSADTATYARQRLMATRAKLQNCAVKASQVIGMRLENCQNEKLGKVEDLGLDLASQKIVLVEVSRGGFAGIDATEVLVPPTALEYDLANDNLKLDVSAQRFQQAPRFDPAKWTDAMTSNQVTAVYSYFDDRPWFLPADARKQDDIAGERAMEIVQNEEAGQKMNSAKQSAFDPTTVRLETKFIGCPVMNAQLENVGKVADCILDVPAGKILAIIVSPSESAGRGELETFPATSFDFGQTNDTIVLKVEKTLISGSGSPASPGASSDRSASVTPLDQGNSHADLSTTAQIRQQIIADKTLSVDAHNVKIITINGHVTLRGAVASLEEKQRVEQIAAKVATAENVTDQLVATENPTTSMNH